MTSTFFATVSYKLNASITTNTQQSPTTSGVTDGGGKPPPWQAKCENRAPFSGHFDI